MADKTKFGKLFKRFRLKAEFSTLSQLSKALVDEGFILEESTLSRWQNGSRIPNDRNLLIAIIKIFIERHGIASIREANMLFEEAGKGYLTESEIQEISKPPLFSPFYISSRKILKFINLVGKSKRILRSGWVREKIQNPESVAEHSFRLSVMAMILADSLGLDKEKLIKMALLHDLGEVITGDVVWSRGAIIDIRKRTEKEEQEKRGIEKIFGIIGEQDEYTKLYGDMIERVSSEAKIFWQLDKLEMAIQALEYEIEQDKKLHEFFVNANLQITHPLLKKILNEILRARKK